LLDLEAPATELARIAAAVGDDQLTAPTPSPDMPVSVLLTHIIGLSMAFRDGARKIKGPTTSTAPNAVAEDLPAEWRQVLPERLGELVAAWRDPAAWEGSTMVGGVTLPAPAAAGFANNELVMHGWDLARATGQEFRVDQDNLEAAWQVVHDTPDDPEVRHGLFGPVIPQPEDAPLLDRTLGHGGRDPAWSPTRR